MGKLAEAWKDYEHKVLPSNSSPVQRIETRRAFYAGARSMFHAMVSCLSEDEEPTAEDEAAMEALNTECDQFLADVLEGKA